MRLTDDRRLQGWLRAGADALFVGTDAGVGRYGLADGSWEPSWCSGPAGPVVLTEDLVLAASEFRIGRELYGVTRPGATTAWDLVVGGNSRPRLTRAAGRLYLPGYDAVRELDAATGERRTEFPTASGEASPFAPAVVDDALFVHAGDVLFGFHLDGDHRFAVDVPVPDGGDGDVVHLLTGPTVAGDGRLFATMVPVPGRNAPAGAVDVPGTHGVLHAFDRETGDPAWTYRTRPGGRFGPPALADGVVFVAETTPDRATAAVGDDATVVHCLDAVDGSTYWTRDLPEASSATAQPTVADGVVYLNTDERFSALSVADGSTRWSTERTEPFVVLDGRIVGVREETLVALA
ncbi:MAG: PQQ-binding-like beta-propeller repeat protein [Halobacteriaceae archaeon]